MSKNYKQNNLVVTHNKKWLKLHEVDSEERYDRVYSFMARTSRYISAEQHLNWWKNFAINKEEIKKWEYELAEAHERRINLTHKVLKEMSEGIINNLTQGIWLSYPHTKEVVKIDEYKTKYYIITLNTGEKFYACKNWIEYDSSRRGRYDYFTGTWRYNKKSIHKQYYGKLHILKKL